ncbi:MAG TPA: hypothetical protein VFH77_01695, partial [Streptomyces sp.]|nr:hypothetical protein [Streptomyces sp.]
MDITTERRDTGAYVIRTVGTQHWPHEDGTWQAHGVRLDLMDGRRTLAVCTLEVPGTAAAEERGAQEADAIEPWMRTLRYLAAARDVRARLDSLESLILRAEDDKRFGSGRASEETVDELLGHATQIDVDTARAAGGADPLGAPLGRIIAGRLATQASHGLRAALAFAPDPTTAPIHPAWELPSHGVTPGESLAQAVARALLAGW